ncbi:MAG: hypothetical protein SO154_10655 [Prevotella sp.]|nr:hypothetical protein [Prevotella sp.]
MNKKILRTEGCKPTTPTSIFRRWCVTAIILCFTMSANAKTDTNNGGVFHGLNDLTGKTLADLLYIATDAPTFSMEEPDKVFFLYNLETKQFLNSGSYWGTHVSLKYYGLPLWVDKVKIDGITYYDRINFVQNLNTGQGQYIAWVLRNNSANDVNSGCYTDVTTGEATGWYFEPTNDGKNSYKIYTKPKDDSSNQYYLHGNPDPYADRKCEADKEGSFDEKYGKWRVFSLQQLYAIQESNMENMTESLELSFKLRCPSFSRGDADITNWKKNVWATGGNGIQRFGLEHLYNKSPKITTNTGGNMTYDVDDVASVVNGYTFPGVQNKITNSKDYQIHLGKYFCADAKNTRGRLYQDIKVTVCGTYVIECKAYSNTTKAKLFAEVVDKNENVIENTLHTTVLWQTSNMSSQQKTDLHIEEQNMDYAGRNFYNSSQYTNSVLVHVSEESLKKGAKIRFGIQIGEDQNDTPIADAAKEWTVFDDFRLLFAAKGVDTDLVLDEDAPDLNYLKECSNTYHNAILHLNKSFQTDKWTSIILPVNLTKNQFTTAFGANARLAELKNVVGTEIRFATRNLQNMKDEDVALVAYKPYILYSTEVNKTTPAYQATLTKTDGSNQQRYVRIKANHIGIPNVTFATKDHANDLSQMDKNWLTIDSYNDENSQLTIHGTFARTFAPNSTQDETTYVWNFNDNNYNKDDKKTIITGRPDLKGCYFFDQGKMWYSASRPRGLRGFSCWIAPKKQGTATSANAKLFLDGIDMTGTTDIEDIFGGEEGKKVEKFANGIYNINGQLVRANSDSTEGLPEGLYIINGKKRLVKH